MTLSIINNVVHGGPALSVPGHLSYGQFLLDKLKQRCLSANQDALINGETGEVLTVKRILQDAVNLGTGLRKMGLKRGDVVALCSGNRIEILVTAIAALCCGATVTTANEQNTKEEMLHVLNISKPNLIFASKEALKKQLKVFRSLKSVNKIVQFDEESVNKGIVPFTSLISHGDVADFEASEVRDPSDTAIILYSSGTTGLSKGVMLTHLNLLYSAANFEVDSLYQEQPTYLTLVPWFHAYGLLSTLGYISIGYKLVYFAGFHPIKYLKAIQDHKVSVLLTVPPIVVFLAKAPIVSQYDISSVETVWCGAAPLSAETIDAALKRLPNCKGIYQAYGMTETCLVATKDSNAVGAKFKPGSGGIPIRGVKVKVVSLETRKILGPYQRGEVCIKGPTVMKGYAGNRIATKDIFDEEGYLKTGDIGYYDEDGYFFIVDRLKELIKYKGHQVPPAVIENVILQHDAVSECGVVGAPDEVAGELATAFVTLKPGASVTEKELLEFSKSKLSVERQLYGGVIFVDEIPKNPSGKILRRTLKQQLLQQGKRRKRSKL